MTTAKIGDISIEYYAEGEGPTLLMVTPLGWHAGTWGEPFLRQLRRSFRIIRFSNRGTGLSEKLDLNCSIELMAQDAAGLLQALRIERTHLFGASMGGAIAQELALNEPGLVHGLVLGCTMCGWKRGLASSLETQPETTGLTQPQSGLEYVRSFWPLLTTPEFARSERVLLQEMEQVVLEKPTPPAALRSQDAAVRAWDSYDRLPQMKVPTLIIHGDADRMVPVGNASILRERIPNARLRILAGAGHAFMWQFPEESARAIIEFLAVVPAAA